MHGMRIYKRSLDKSSFSLGLHSHLPQIPKLYASRCTTQLNISDVKRSNIPSRSEICDLEAVQPGLQIPLCGLDPSPRPCQSRSKLQLRVKSLLTIVCMRCAIVKIVESENSSRIVFDTIISEALAATHSTHLFRNLC